MSAKMDVYMQYPQKEAAHSLDSNGNAQGKTDVDMIDVSQAHEEESRMELLAGLEMELAFLRCLPFARPIGKHRHFQIIALQKLIQDMTGTAVPFTEIWTKLEEMYDLEELDGMASSSSSLPGSPRSLSPLSFARPQHSYGSSEGSRRNSRQSLGPEDLAAPSTPKRKRRTKGKAANGTLGETSQSDARSMRDQEPSARKRRRGKSNNDSEGDANPRGNHDAAKDDADSEGDDEGGHSSSDSLSPPPPTPRGAAFESNTNGRPPRGSATVGPSRIDRSKTRTRASSAGTDSSGDASAMSSQKRGRRRSSGRLKTTDRASPDPDISPRHSAITAEASVEMLFARTHRIPFPDYTTERNPSVKSGKPVEGDERNDRAQKKEREKRKGSKSEETYSPSANCINSRHFRSAFNLPLLDGIATAREPMIPESQSPDGTLLQGRRGLHDYPTWPGWTAEIERKARRERAETDWKLTTRKESTFGAKSEPEAQAMNELMAEPALEVSVPLRDGPAVEPVTRLAEEERSPQGGDLYRDPEPAQDSPGGQEVNLADVAIDASKQAAEANLGEPVEKALQGNEIKIDSVTAPVAARQADNHPKGLLGPEILSEVTEVKGNQPKTPQYPDGQAVESNELLDHAQEEEQSDHRPTMSTSSRHQPQSPGNPDVRREFDGVPRDTPAVARTGPAARVIQEVVDVDAEPYNDQLRSGSGETFPLTRASYQTYPTDQQPGLNGSREMRMEQARQAEGYRGAPYFQPGPSYRTQESERDYARQVWLDHERSLRNPGLIHDARGHMYQRLPERQSRIDPRPHEYKHDQRYPGSTYPPPPPPQPYRSTSIASLLNPRSPSPQPMRYRSRPSPPANAYDPELDFSPARSRNEVQNGGRYPVIAPLETSGMYSSLVSGLTGFPSAEPQRTDAAHNPIRFGPYPQHGPLPVADRSQPRFMAIPSSTAEDEDEIVNTLEPGEESDEDTIPPVRTRRVPAILPEASSDGNEGFTDREGPALRPSSSATHSSPLPRSAVARRRRTIAPSEDESDEMPSHDERLNSDRGRTTHDETQDLPSIGKGNKNSSEEGLLALPAAATTSDGDDSIATAQTKGKPKRLTVPTGRRGRGRGRGRARSSNASSAAGSRSVKGSPPRQDRSQSPGAAASEDELRLKPAVQNRRPSANEADSAHSAEHDRRSEDIASGREDASPTRGKTAARLKDTQASSSVDPTLSGAPPLLTRGTVRSREESSERDDSPKRTKRSGRNAIPATVERATRSNASVDNASAAGTPMARRSTQKEAAPTTRASGRLGDKYTPKKRK